MSEDQSGPSGKLRLSGRGAAIIPANETIRDPVIETLAIILHEHSCPSGRFPGTLPSWMAITEEERQGFRDAAAGKIPCPRRQYSG